jgi:biotin operon repressor
VLRLTAAEGEFPSGAEVAKRLGMPERSAQELLSSLKAFLSRIA